MGVNRSHRLAETTLQDADYLTCISDAMNLDEIEARANVSGKCEYDGDGALGLTHDFLRVGLPWTLS